MSRISQRIAERSTKTLRGQRAYLKAALNQGHPDIYGEKERLLLFLIDAELDRRYYETLQAQITDQHPQPCNDTEANP